MILKTKGEWKNQLIIAINFIHFNETFTMCKNSDNIEVMMGNEKNKIIENV